MLKKLVFLDIKLNIKEVLFPSLSVIILGALLGLLMNINAPGFIINLLLPTWIFSIIGLLIYSFVIMYKLLYKNLFEREGAFYFSIPTKVFNILLTKLISSFIMLTIVTTAVILSLFIFFTIMTDGMLIDLTRQIGDLFEISIGSITLLITLMIIFAITSTLLNIVSFMLAVLVIKDSNLKRFKLPVTFILWQLISSTVSTITLPLVFFDLNFNLSLFVMSVLNTGIVIGLLIASSVWLDKKIDI